MQTSNNYVVRLCLNAEQGICIKYRRPLANLTEIEIRVSWLVVTSAKLSPAKQTLLINA